MGRLLGKRYLRGFVIPHGQQAQTSEAAQSSTQSSQSFVLSHGVGDASDKGSGNSVVVPYELIIDGKGSVGDDVFANGEAHAGAKMKRGCDGKVNDAVPAHDFGRDGDQSASFLSEI
ncbi:hypothetical protein M0R45_036974 [Rubus argutus]|uniref:Uncharacterized protein n=1 Tax=Rubus argutus TaxID=59490 RepID=A0AAW1W345_RUBAR